MRVTAPACQIRPASRQHGPPAPFPQANPRPATLSGHHRRACPASRPPSTKRAKEALQCSKNHKQTKWKKSQKNGSNCISRFFSLFFTLSLLHFLRIRGGVRVGLYKSGGGSFFNFIFFFFSVFHVPTEAGLCWCSSSALLNP